MNRPFRRRRLRPLLLDCGNVLVGHDGPRPVITRCPYSTLDPDMEGWINGRFYCPDCREEITAATRMGLTGHTWEQHARLLHDVLTGGGDG